MTSCMRGRDSATPECFRQGSRGTIFVRSSKLSLFFPELCSFRRVFCFPLFCKIWRQAFELWGFWFQRCLGALFENSAPSPGIFANSDWDHKYFLKISILFFFKAEPVLLAWRPWWSPGWAKHFCDGTSKTRTKTWLPGVGEIERRRTVERCRDWYESNVVIHGQKETKTQRSQGVIERSCNTPSSTKQASFEEPVSDIRCRYRFALCCFCAPGGTAAGQSGCAARGQRRKAVIRDISCWSLRRNKLECTKLVQSH